MKPVVLLTCGNDISDKGLPRFALAEAYAAAISLAGGIPLAVTALQQDDIAECADFADALLLTGGGDIAPNLYGEQAIPNVKINYEHRRDELELKLFESFFNANKPVFGICRGMQLINVALGGNLWQDIPMQTGKNHSDVTHTVQTAENSLLSRFFGSGLEVNSLHHQAVKTLGNDLVASVFSDGIIEGIEHKSKHIFGVQFHPERMNRTNKIFEYFINLARK